MVTLGVEPPEPASIARSTFDVSESASAISSPVTLSTRSSFCTITS